MHGITGISGKSTIFSNSSPNQKRYKIYLAGYNDDFIKHLDYQPNFTDNNGYLCASFGCSGNEVIGYCEHIDQYYEIHLSCKTNYKSLLNADLIIVFDTKYVDSINKYPIKCLLHDPNNPLEFKKYLN